MAEICEMIEAAPTANPTSAKRWLRLIALAWALLVAGGLWMLWRYSGTPGRSADPPERWPAASSIRLSPSKKTLVMFVHPRCPCTRASLAQLARIAAKCQGELTAWIVFATPKGVKPGWEQGDLWEIAGSIPTAHRLVDTDGIESARFHAATSGEAVVYDSNGMLLFHGGITGARGHEGDNEGQDSVVEIMNEGTSSCRATPVFGCPIDSTSSMQ